MPENLIALYLQPLQHDIQETVGWSEERFGAAAERYGELIGQAMRDVL